MARGKINELKYPDFELDMNIIALYRMRLLKKLKMIDVNAPEPVVPPFKCSRRGYLCTTADYLISFHPDKVDLDALFDAIPDDVVDEDDTIQCYILEDERVVEYREVDRNEGAEEGDAGEERREEDLIFPLLKWEVNIERGFYLGDVKAAAGGGASTSSFIPAKGSWIFDLYGDRNGRLVVLYAEMKEWGEAWETFGDELDDSKWLHNEGENRVETGRIALFDSSFRSAVSDVDVSLLCSNKGLIADTDRGAGKYKYEILRRRDIAGRPVVGILVNFIPILP